MSGQNNPNYGKGYLIKGEKHPFYGKHQSEEFKKRLSEMSKGEGNNMYGKNHTDETKKKLHYQILIDNQYIVLN